MNATQQSSSCNIYTGALSNTLVRSADEERYLGHFWSAYLPNGRALSADAVQESLGSWTNTVQKLYSTDDTLKRTLLAMCLSSYGKQQGKKWIKEQGFRLYSAALQDMAVALKVPSRAKSDSILTASKLFSLYEVSSPHYRPPQIPV